MDRRVPIEPNYLSADATALPDLELYSSKPQPLFTDSPSESFTLHIYLRTVSTTMVHGWN